MVDYNLQVPGIAPLQQPQINPMQMIPLMQQQQLNNMLMQERARELQEAGAVRNVLARPGFTGYTPEGRQELIRAAPTKVGPALSRAYADIDKTQREAEEARIRAAAAVQKMGIERFDALSGRLASVDPADPAGYATWHKIAAPSMTGVPLPTPEEWAKATPEQRVAVQRRLLTDAATIRTMVLKEAEESNKPVPGTIRTNARGEEEFVPSQMRRGEVPVITPVLGAPVGAAVGAQPNRMAATYGGLSPVQPAGADQYRQPPNALVQSDTFIGQQPGVQRPAAGKMTERVEPLGGFAPATGMTAEQEAQAKARGEARGKQEVAEPEQIRARRAEAVKARTEVGGNITTLEDAIKAARSVRSLSPQAKETITGLSTYFPPASAQAREAETKLKNLEGAVTQMGRAVAAESGKPGSMQVQEWEIMRDQVATLRTSKMSPADLDRQIDIIVNKASAMVKRMREGYDLAHEEAVKKDPRLALPKSSVEEAPAAGTIAISPETQRLLDKYK